MHTNINRVEHPELVAQRITRSARCVDKDHGAESGSLE